MVRQVIISDLNGNSPKFSLVIEEEQCYLSKTIFRVPQIVTDLWQESWNLWSTRTVPPLQHSLIRNGVTVFSGTYAQARIHRVATFLDHELHHCLLTSRDCIRVLPMVGLGYRVPNTEWYPCFSPPILSLLQGMMYRLLLMGYLSLKDNSTIIIIPHISLLLLKLGHLLQSRLLCVLHIVFRLSVSL